MSNQKAVMAPIKLPTPLRTFLGIKPVRPLGAFQPVTVESIKMGGEYYPYNDVQYIFPDTTLNFINAYLNNYIGPIVFTHKNSADGVESSERAYMVRKGDTYEVKLPKSFEEPCTATASGKALIGSYESDSFTRKFKIGTLHYEPNPTENYPLYPTHCKASKSYSSHLESLKRQYPPTRLSCEFGVENGEYIASKNRTYYIPKPRGSITPYVIIKNVSNISLHSVLLFFYIILVHEDEHYVNWVDLLKESFDVMRAGEEHKLSLHYTCDWNKDYGHVYLQAHGAYMYKHHHMFKPESDYSDLKLGRGVPP